MSLTPPPAEMIAEDRWVLWRFGASSKGKPKKVPCQVNGDEAKVNKPSTWNSYAAVVAEHTGSDRYEGIGFMLGDGWAGIDLDNVIVDDETKPWAADIVADLGSYSEISPSGEGVKVFVKGEFEGKGRNEPQSDGSAVEIYCRGRYFTVTGNRYPGTPHEVRPAGAKLQHYYNQLCSDGFVRVDDSFENMKHRLSQMPESISGQNGSRSLVAAACEIVRWGFDDEQAMSLLQHYDEERCLPAWGDYELGRALESAKERVAEENGGVLPTPSKNPAVPRTPFSLELVDDVTFKGLTYDQSFLIDGLVVRGEPLILGGPSKTLKTSILVDLAVSLANGVPALGHFPVQEKQPVIVVSGESGGATLQKTADRIRSARGVSASKNLYWGLRLPNLSLKEHLDALKLDIERTGAQLVAVDPAYLSLLAGDDGDAAKNVFRMGIILNAFGQVGKDTGCCLVLVHHFNKQIKQGQAPVLSHLSQSGFSEWARQWILLNHNKPYQQGMVELAVNVGGSAGHGGKFLWSVDQGLQRTDSVGWTSWDVKVEDLDAPDFSEPPKEDLVAKRIERVCQGVEWGELYTASSLRELAKLGTGKDDGRAWAELEQYLLGAGVVEKTTGNPIRGGSDTGIRYLGLLA